MAGQHLLQAVGAGGTAIGLFAVAIVERHREVVEIEQADLGTFLPGVVRQALDQASIDGGLAGTGGKGKQTDTHAADSR